MALTETGVLIIVFVGGALVLTLNYLFRENVLGPFKRQRRYILEMISRAETQEDYALWKSELKILYLSYVPIARKFVKSKAFAKNTD